PLPVLLNVWVEPTTVLNCTAVPLPLIVPVLLRTLVPEPPSSTPGPPVPVICPSFPMVSGPEPLIPRTPWMMAPELLVIWPPPPSVMASPPPTLSCAPDSMLTVTLLLPGWAVIPVVTGLGWLLSQVTVWPVVGASVGVQAARAVSIGQE